MELKKSNCKKFTVSENQPKTVLVYVTQLMSRGGIESHILEFISELSEEGVIIDLLVPNFQMNLDLEHKLKKSCRRLVLNRTTSRSLYNHLWLIKALLRTRDTNYDALYTNGQGSSIYICSKLSKYTKWVHHHHTAGDLADQRTWGTYYVKALKCSDTLIACSKTNARAMSSSLNRAVDSIPCFSRDLGPCSVRTKEEEGYHIHLGYFGRLIKEKGIELISKMSLDKDCEHIRFHIWGADPQYSEIYFEDFPNLDYHGAFSGVVELKRAVCALDAFILLSTHPEGLPISLLEVMSAGLPWLATNRGGIPDIAQNKDETVVIPFDLNYSGYKAAVLNFVENLQRGKANRQEQLNLYASKFSAAVIRKSWYSCFFNL